MQGIHKIYSKENLNKYKQNTTVPKFKQKLNSTQRKKEYTPTNIPKNIMEMQKIDIPSPNLARERDEQNSSPSNN